MIETNESLLSLSDAAKTLPHRPNAATIWRWARKGVRGVRLDYLRVGARIYTSQEAIRRFGQAMAAIDDVPAVQTRPPAKRTAQQRAQAIEQARATLQASKAL